MEANFRQGTNRSFAVFARKKHQLALEIIDGRLDDRCAGSTRLRRTVTNLD